MGSVSDFESLKEGESSEHQGSRAHPLWKEFYPGSRHTIQPHVSAERVDDPERWDAKPRKFRVGGVDREFFTIGHLAKALLRKPVTIRAWERAGVIPKPTFRRPSEDPRGTRRLYTRAQVEGMVRIAEEEGLMKGDYRSVSNTDFTRRVIALFRELAAAE